MRGSVSEYLTAQFYAWEQRGRGWKVFDEPVELESDFIPFFGHFSPNEFQENDDGQRPRFFPGIQEALGLFNKKSNLSFEEEYERLDELYPINAFQYDNPYHVTELQVHFDKDTRIQFEHIEQLLLMLSTSEGIVGFEIIGTGQKISIHFTCSNYDVSSFKSHIAAYVPGAIIIESHNALSTSLDTDKVTWVTDLGLQEEFMRPLKVWTKYDPDPLTGAIATLESLEDGEFGMVQILFQPAINPWAESIQKAIIVGGNTPFFPDAPEMLPFTKEKISSPLFAIILRTVSQADTEERAAVISTRIAQTFNSFKRTGSNSFIPLSAPLSCDVDDIIERRSRRIGMILNSNELAGLVHIPDRSILSPKLRAYTGKTKRAPQEVEGYPFKLGINSHLGQETIVTLSDQHRLRHMHVIGATGTGKSTLLLNLITQDIEQGRGIAVLDPHGDLIEEILQYIPDDRLQDVVLVDPSDSEYPIGLNLLSANTDTEKIILSSDMVALFRRFSTSWGDQMTSVLANSINAILESSQGGTLIDLRRFLVELSFRNKFLQTIEDPSIIYYWKNEFQLLRSNTVAPILTRLDTFLRPRVVRNMMAQKDGLDFREILNTKKILLVKLAQGLIGEENSYLLGTLFVAKLHQAAQTRQNISADQRTPFFVYIDEFQNFITPSMSAILSGARKYGLGLILAHQDLDQLAQKDTELANSVLSNPAIRVCFRCGDKDAAKLESGFSYFDSTDLQSLGIGQAIVRVGKKDHDFNVSFEPVEKAEALIAEVKQKSVVDFCRSNYALHQNEVELILKEALDANSGKSTKVTEVVEKPEMQIGKPTEKIFDEGRPTTKIHIEVEAKQFVEKEIEKEKLREHRFIQEYIKKIAEARNFKAVIEEPVNDYAGKVDVSLLHDDLRIACEISVSNTIQYEVQNIQKCFRAGFGLVFMISNDQKHLNSIRSLAITEIDEAFHKYLYFVSKEEFVTQLDLLLAQNIQPVETRAKGYRVKVNYNNPKDLKSQQNTLKDIILSTVKRDRDIDEIE